MAETPLCAYAAVDSAPAGLVLTVLYKHAPWAAVRDYLSRAGAVPFAGCSPARVSDCLPRMSRAQVYVHLKTLRELGLIKPSREVCQDGVERDGFQLLARDDGQPVPGDSSEGCQQRSSESGKPDSGTASARPAVRKTGQHESGNPDIPVRETGRASPGNRIAPSGKPDCNSLQNRDFEQIEQIKDDELSTQVPEKRAREADPVSTTTTTTTATSSRATQAPAPRAVARRPYRDAPDGQPVGGASAARALLVELAHLHRPADAGRCFTPSNRRHLELAELLLAVSPGPGEDAGAVANDRLQLVLGYVRDFAELIRDDPKQEEFWRPNMLATTPGPGRSLSAWDMIVRDVDAWRRRRRGEREAAAAVEVRRQREREEAEQLQRRRMDPAEVARATARFTGADPDQAERHDEQLRRQGRAREADAVRDEWSEIDIRRRTNEALTAAMKANGGQLSQAQAEDIRRRVRGEGATAT